MVIFGLPAALIGAFWRKAFFCLPKNNYRSSYLKELTSLINNQHMTRTPGISPSEWKVMKVLWAKSPLTAVEVVHALDDVEDWHPNTIKTLLTRLCRKGAVAVNKHKSLYEYRPLYTEAECVQTESKSFLERIFGGAVRPLLVHFVEKQKVTADDIEELKKILRKKQK
jgi:BlaI family penicillinase repressor